MKRAPGLLILIAASAFAQRPDLLEASKWRGTVSGRGHMTQMDLPFPVPGTEITGNASFAVTLELERSREDPPLWSGKIVNSTFTADYSETLTGGNCVISVSAHASSLDEASEPSTLEFNGQRGFTVFIGTRGGTTTFIKTTVCNGAQLGPPETSLSGFFIPQSTKVIPFPVAGQALTGTATIPEDVSSSSTLPGHRELQWDLDVHLSPVGDLELVIDESVAYRRWRPHVASSGAGGVPLRLTAKLESRSGKPVASAITSVTWELVGTSREPGLALNFPVNAKGSDDSFDLELASDGSDFQLLNRNQLLVKTKAIPEQSDTVSIIPFDWGGWSELQVKAVLDTGIELTGKLKSTNEERIRLPKRAPDSRIADRWKERLGVSEGDASDEEMTPAGDGHAGDGLTLYEEYRGFFEDGEHTEGSPIFKDLFIRNRAMAAMLGGLAWFSREAGVEVHYKLSESELPASRVINANYDAAPHAVDQHALVVFVKPGLRDMSFASRVGPPKLVDYIAIQSNWDKLDVDVVAYVGAHEIAHGVGVRHHGEGDRQKVVWKVVGGVLVEAWGGVETPITVVDDAAVNDFTPYAIAMLNEADPMRPTREYWVGVRGGQHSGSTHCFMRYIVAKKAVPPGLPNARREVTEPQPVGDSICDLGAGDGINPVEFGDASVGGCSHQIIINDRYAP